MTHTDRSHDVDSTGVDSNDRWWKRAVVYQIYPRSFAEGTPTAGNIPDGIGDLRGIIERLDHLVWLGVDAIWLSPIFTSPMADFGYDVADYCDVDPVFGTMDDFDDLVSAAHARGLKLLLDWVPNHTSIEHPWFVESRSNRTNPKADWYIWRDEPPNNWRAAFPRGDSAWQWDEGRQQWYLRNFTREQPDLDWNHPDVEAAMLDTLRFWLDRGVDGFRMDVVHMIGKDLGIDDPPAVTAKSWSHVPLNDVPITHERLRRIRQVLEEYPGDRCSIGEVYLLDEAAVATYYGDHDELNMSFNFPFLWTDANPVQLRERIVRTLQHLDPIGAWPTWVLSNHDVPRHLTRHGGDDNVARMMCLMLLSLPGTPFLYQGEELGLADATIEPHQVVDPGLRDGSRAPIPWTGDAEHGWHAPTWLPFPDHAERINVASLTNDPSSMLHLYRAMLGLRRETDQLQVGRFQLLDLGDQALAYRRGDDWWIILNFGDSPLPIETTLRVLICSDPKIDVAVVLGSVPPRTAVVGRTS